MTPEEKRLAATIRQRAYVERNRQRVNQKNRERYAADPKGSRERREKWAAKVGGFNEVARRYRHTFGGRVSALLRDARARSKAKGLPCDLTREWISERLSKTCELTGLPFELGPRGKSKTQPYAPSLDRKNPGGPYSKENTRLVLWALNMALADHGEDVYAAIARAYLANRGGSGLS